MSKLYTYITLMLLVFCTTVNAQKLTVESFTLAENDISALSKARQDLNGKNCALIKVGIALQNVKFEGNVMGDVERKTSEYWVYMPQGTSMLKLSHSDYLPLMINFFDYNIGKLQSGCTYILNVQKPAGTYSTAGTSTAATQQYVLFELMPKDAVVEFDGEYLNVNDGTATKRKAFGTYSYTVTAPMYHEQTGSVTVNDPENKHVVNVSLNPAYGYLEIPASGNMDGAKVYVNDELKGTVPYKSGRMASGTYNVRIVKQMYNAVQKQVTIEDNNTTTFSATMSADFANVTLTTASGAAIYVNDEKKGTTTWSGRLSSGAYKIETRRDNHRPYSREVTISPDMEGQTITLNGPTPIYGSLDINSSPANADIILDGNKIGTTPKFVSQCLIGKHAIEIKKSGYGDYSNSFTIQEGQTFDINATLQNGREITITAPQGADIYIDDSKVANTSYNGTLTFGSHKIYAQLNGRKGTVQSVTVTQGTSRLKDIVLTIVPSENGHEYVDLGLSVKWATCNVGASKPEDYGDYYAWGETRTKTDYSWKTYFDSVNGSSSNFNKYATNKKTSLSPEDDVAHVKWGGKWRMPTKAEQDELREKCTWTWTTQNGVKGYKVTSKKNGNSIFLPAAGYRDDASLSYAGSSGYYWSSSLDTSYSNYAYYLYFNSSYVGWNGNDRCSGRSVRAVCP